jgi:hypothetical protein
MTRADTGQDKETRAGTGLEAIAGAARKAGRKGPPPVHLWNPPYCGEIGLKIATDGTWFYQGSPIGRMPLVKLFASVLKREDGRHYLVTPVEKIGIDVEDAPFLAVEMRRVQAGATAETMEQLPESASSALFGEERRLGEGYSTLVFRTNVDDWVACGSEHALRFEPEPETGGLKPYLHVRRDLWAKVTRPLFYDLVDMGEERVIEGEAMFGVASGGAFFPMCPAKSLQELR